MTPVEQIITAAINRDFDAVNTLAKKGHLPDSYDANYKTPAMLLAKRNDLASVKWLSVFYKVNLNLVATAIIEEGNYNNIAKLMYNFNVRNFDLTLLIQFAVLVKKPDIVFTLQQYENNKNRNVPHSGRSIWRKPAEPALGFKLTGKLGEERLKEKFNSPETVWPKKQRRV